MRPRQDDWQMPGEFGAELRTVTGDGYMIRTFNQSVFISWLTDTLQALASFPASSSPAYQPVAHLRLWAGRTEYQFQTPKDIIDFLGKLEYTFRLPPMESR